MQQNTVMLAVEFEPMFHDEFEWSQELLLEAEVGQFSALEKLHRQLTQRIDREKCHLLVRVQTSLWKEKRTTINLIT